MSNTDRKPVLSISFLSCGRPKTLKKCLDSLMPIMKKIPCELIVVDTGCNTEQINLLKQYTDCIVSFEWCNDFSKARNVGLEKACGEWFLYLDDDEWFEDASEIISFFEKGEYKKYGYACYLQRNYTDYSEKKWNDAWVSRMVRLDKNIHFESSIHEYLYPIKGECKLLNSYVKHFGYVFESEEEKMNHAKRNISLLYEMLQEEPDNIRWWTQLAQEYMVIKAYDKLEDVCVKGMERFKNKDTNVINSERGTFYLGTIMANLVEHNYEGAEKCYLDAIKDKRNTNVCKAMLYARIAEMYYNLEKYEECTHCCKEYMKLYDVLNGDEEAIFLQGAFFTYDVCRDDVRDNVYCFYIKCCALKGDVDGFISTFYNIGIEKEHIYIYHTFITDILDGFATLPYTEEFVKMAQAMMDRNGINRLTIERLQQIEKEDKEKFVVLYRIFEQIDSPAIIKNPKPVQKKPEVTSEMQQLATQIKSQIQVLLDQGLYKEAATVLSQLKTYVPVDEEITAMERQITEKF